MRSVALMALGLMIGVLAAVMILGAMRQQTRFDRGLMAVIAHHDGKLRRAIDAGQCDTAKVRPHLRQLQSAAIDLEAAFLPTQDDARFRNNAQALRAALATSAQEKTSDCTRLAAAYTAVGDTCKACHQDFRR